MSKLFKRMTGFRGRWAAAKHRADRITLTIAEDQALAWMLRPGSRRRTQAIKGWGALYRSMVPA